MIWVGLGGFVGRLSVFALSDIIGRKLTGGLAAIWAAVFLVLMAVYHASTITGIPVFWLLLVVGYVCCDGIFAVVGPYSAEVWPTSLRATGMGWAFRTSGLLASHTWGRGAIT